MGALLLQRNWMISTRRWWTNRGTDKINFIEDNKISLNRRKDVTYGNIVVDYRPQKAAENRTRLTVVGNLIDFPGDVSTPTADITTTKLVINSTVSTPNAEYMCGGINKFLLGTPMDRKEYMRLPISIIPQEIIDEYNLAHLLYKGLVYIEICKGMYGLPQAGILANQLLTKRLAPHGYYVCRHTPGLWRHKWRPVLFLLVVDDFGIKYVVRDHIDHLIATIEHHNEFSKNWEGKLYCGITLKWDYHARTCDLSMPGYLQAEIHRLQHPHPSRDQHSPHQWIELTYGARQQLTAPINDTQPLTPDLINRVH
jgi:hypothetical protein